MMEFDVFHKYRRLVARGILEPLKCPSCDVEYTVRIGAFDEPVLECFSCNSLLQPGGRLYNDMKAEVERVFG